MSIAKQLRDAVIKSERTRESIARGAGLDPGQLSRLMSGERSLVIETAEKLAAELGLEIVLRPKVGRAKRKAESR